MYTHITSELPKVITEAGLPVVSSIMPFRRPPVFFSRRRYLTLYLFPWQDFTRQSIFGHSMGGHGALTLYLSSLLNGTKQYRSASAFAPISNPTKCPWGNKAFSGYLAGGVEEAKERYDATELISKLSNVPVHILIDYVSERCSHG